MNPTTSRPVRVRIAPSPTGAPHVGLASMALFNYVFAKKHGGQFIIRIEDTDRTRYDPESEAKILEGIRWTGLSYDEGPDVGGPYGPYRQSERAQIHQQHAQQLLDKGAAYCCFCTAERLAEMRERQKQAKQSMRYDRKCLGLPADEVKRRLGAGEEHVVRLRVPDSGATVFEDKLRGVIRIDNREIDDQVLLKSDGFPTYHLASVVDDHLMQISHVIRAEEWITSTPKHILLYQAFGWEPPEFIHMPILRDPNRGKIKKREGVEHFALDYYRRVGYLPEALLNFLGLMGWSLDADQEVFSLQQMIDGFTWDNAKTSAPVFDLQKLEWLNGVYIRELTPEQLLDRIIDGGHTAHADEPRDRMLAITALAQERLKTLAEFDELTAFFFADLEYAPDDLIPAKKKNKKTKTQAETVDMLKTMADKLAALDEWKCERMEKLMRVLAEDSGWKTRELFTTLRVATTCRRVSTPLFESMEIFGKDVCVRRMQTAIERLEAMG